MVFAPSDEKMELLKERKQLLDELKEIDIEAYSTKTFSVEALCSQLKIYSDRYGLNDVKAKFGGEAINCLVASAGLATSSAIMQGSGHIDILDHLADLIPKTTGRIGLVTFQNGIMNSVKDFRRMGELILKQFPEKPLLMGLYNPVLMESKPGEGILHHRNRLGKHIARTLTPVVARTYLFFREIMKRVQAIQPKLIWVHVAHSEGAAIAHLALDQLHKRGEIAPFKRHMITAAYGPVMPIPQECVLDSINTYSDGDILVNGYREAVLKVPGGYTYNVRTVPKEGKLREFVSEARRVADQVRSHSMSLGILEGVDKLNHDHAFAGETYQRAFADDLDKIRDKLTRGEYAK